MRPARRAPPRPATTPRRAPGPRPGTTRPRVPPAAGAGPRRASRRARCRGTRRSGRAGSRDGTNRAESSHEGKAGERQVNIRPTGDVRRRASPRGRTYRASGVSSAGT
ncbi:hypothetical protein M768_07985 [Cellulosimicrobium cellulans F16]|uniref:Uncharacterized protein n=1 Tax=Cellulosimicrobium cellulans F16 TaxID=1350482 RepID=A0A0M0F8N9_CELCE|nr:hypothetical protein M768_07985 [Cellulosimicrobium cellulans F16]